MFRVDIRFRCILLGETLNAGYEQFQRGNVCGFGCFGDGRGFAIGY